MQWAYQPILEQYEFQLNRTYLSNYFIRLGIVLYEDTYKGIHYKSRIKLTRNTKV